MTRKTVLCVVCCLCCVPVFGCLAGCAQNTAAPVDQPSQQFQTPISDQAAQGSKSDVRVWVINAPGENGIPSDDRNLILQLDDPSGELPSVGSAASNEAGNEVRDPKAGYVIAGLTFNIHTGGSSTGPQSTGAVGPMSAQPGATITQSPEQKPEGSVQVAPAIALPGGVASGSAAGATGSGSVTLSAEQQAELRTALLRAMQGDSQAWLKIAELMGMVFEPAPAPQPGAPVEPPPVEPQE